MYHTHKDWLQATVRNECQHENNPKVIQTVNTREDWQEAGHTEEEEARQPRLTTYEPTSLGPLEGVQESRNELDRAPLLVWVSVAPEGRWLLVTVGADPEAVVVAWRVIENLQSFKSIEIDR